MRTIFRRVIHMGPKNNPAVFKVVFRALLQHLFAEIAKSRRIFSQKFVSQIFEKDINFIIDI